MERGKEENSKEQEPRDDNRAKRPVAQFGINAVQKASREIQEAETA